MIVATSLDAARRLLGRRRRCAGPAAVRRLLDLALRTVGRGRDRSSSPTSTRPAGSNGSPSQDPSLAPAGEQLLQGQFPVGPGDSRADGIARAGTLLDLGFPGWRERTVWRRESLATGRTGAVDLPGTTWRDRPRIDRGDGVYLAGDQVAAPGVLSEVAFNSGIAAASRALQRSPARGETARPGLKHA